MGNIRSAAAANRRDDLAKALHESHHTDDATEPRDTEDGELDPARCYQAILARDRRFDGRFFTGVVTTGVYCRPICPVSPPKFKNMRWYRHAAAAEAAGFRPCMRCRPETAPGTPAWLGTSAVVTRALRLIEAGGLDGDGNVDALAERLGIGGRQLRRLFAQHLGASPAEVARVRRVHFARSLIDDTDLPLTTVAFSAGFNSVRAFNHAIRETFRRAPRDLRRSAHAAAERAATGALMVRLPFRPPLEWDAIVRYLAARATPGVEVVADGVYRRTIEVEREAGAFEVRPDAKQPVLLMRVWLPRYDHLIDVVERVRRVFDLTADPFAITTDLARDPALAARVAARPGLRVPGAWDGFELAVRAILGQQVTVGGATTLAGRLVQCFGTPVDGMPSGLTHLFPHPGTLVDAAIEVIGLPRARAATIRALAAALHRGDLALDGSRDVEETTARLRAIPGIGTWTSDYVAMRGLGEPDAFPSGDLGLRRAFANGSGLASAHDIERRAEAWRPWRSYAAMHLWMEG